MRRARLWENSKRPKGGGKEIDKVKTPETQALRLENIGRYFNPPAALEAVSLSLQKGDIACLAVRSGCRKSSLLRLVAGVDKPDAGRIFFAGEKVAGPDRFVEPERRNAGFLFQDYSGRYLRQMLCIIAYAYLNILHPVGWVKRGVRAMLGYSTELLLISFAALLYACAVRFLAIASRIGRDDG